MRHIPAFHVGGPPALRRRAHALLVSLAWETATHIAHEHGLPVWPTWRLNHHKLGPKAMDARCLTLYLLATRLGMSRQDIADTFGYYGPTTVWNNVQKGASLAGRTRLVVTLMDARQPSNPS